MLHLFLGCTGLRTHASHSGRAGLPRPPRNNKGKVVYQHDAERKGAVRVLPYDWEAVGDRDRETDGREASKKKKKKKK